LLRFPHIGLPNSTTMGLGRPWARPYEEGSNVTIRFDDPSLQSPGVCDDVKGRPVPASQKSWADLQFRIGDRK
jgi:hypothetical protein